MTGQRRGRPSLTPVNAATGGARQPDALRVYGDCVGLDPELFFDEDRIDEAKAVCTGCHLIAGCGVHALRHEKYGVWGGSTPEERDVVRGGPLLFTPEDARLADRFRAMRARGDKVRDIARSEGLEKRTLERFYERDAA